MTAERITDLAISLRDDARITTPEDVFGIILSALVRTFQRAMSVRAMAQGLNLVAAHILENSSDEDSKIREMYPQGPGNVRPENN